MPYSFDRRFIRAPAGQLMTALVRALPVLAAALLLALALSPAHAHAMVAGKPVTDKERQDKGLVALPGCSGVLLANDWLLTAGHCVDQNRTAPAGLTATLGTQTERADAVYLFAGYSQEVGPDLGLVHLARPLTVNGRTSGFRTRFWSGSKADLAGKTVASYGRGNNVASAATPTMPACTAGGFGPYRATNFTVAAGDFEPAAQVVAPTTSTWSSVAGGRYAQLIHPGNGRIAPGDSGGPSFVFSLGRPYLVGIHSGSACPGNAAWDVAIPAVRDWIVAVTRSQWHPGVANEHVWVRQPEIAGTRWGLTDVDATGWAQAARAAAAMCYSRGFAGGHFEGHQSAPGVAGGYGLQCSGPGARWLNVTAGTIAATGWGFTDVNAVSWAQAGRAAERLCARYRGIFAGGQFNGHMRDGRYGLFCYRTTAAQWFDATAAELAATGWGFTDVNTVSWAQAARAATGFCVGRGFSGGFMNGHQLNGRYGVVCQRR
jgi:hypothetical protein